MNYPVPINEAKRIKTLRRYQILDTPSEPAFDDLTRLAATICGSRISLISLIDERRQWFKSKFGIDVDETPREWAFCAHAILESDPLVVPDATADTRFAQNPLVLEDPKIRFYAGAPLQASDGNNIGTLCVIDQTPRDLTDEQREGLELLSRQVIAQLELRLMCDASKKLEVTRRELQGANERWEDLYWVTEDLKNEAKSASRTRIQQLAMMSHEIQTSINGLRDMTEQPLAAAWKPEQQRKCVETVYASGQILLNVIDDLLDHHS